MGVKGLWQLIAPAGKPISLDSLDGKVLAVDVSIWLNKAAKGMRDRTGNQVYNAHLVLMFHRICKLLFYGIKPVIVFDGGVPELKKSTLRARRDRKRLAESRKQKGNEAIIKNFLQTKALESVTGTKSSTKLNLVTKEREADLFELPALPLENSQSESSEDEMLEDEQWLESLHSNNIQAMLDSPDQVDVESEEFRALPSEVKHEILVAIKDYQRKRFRRRYKGGGTSANSFMEALPEEATDFSDYQLKNLNKRGQITHHIDQLRKEMNDSMSTEFLDLLPDKKINSANSMVESRRIASSDNRRTVLIKHAPKSRDENLLFTTSLDDDYARFKKREGTFEDEFRQLERVPAKFETVRCHNEKDLLYPKFFSDDSSGDEMKGHPVKPDDDSNNLVENVDLLTDDSSESDADWIEVDAAHVEKNKNLSTDLPKIQEVFSNDETLVHIKSNNENKLSSVDFKITSEPKLSDTSNIILTNTLNNETPRSFPFNSNDEPIDNYVNYDSKCENAGETIISTTSISYDDDEQSRFPLSKSDDKPEKAEDSNGENISINDLNPSVKGRSDIDNILREDKSNKEESWYEKLPGMSAEIDQCKRKHEDIHCKFIEKESDVSSLANETGEISDGVDGNLKKETEMEDNRPSNPISEASLNENNDSETVFGNSYAAADRDNFRIESESEEVILNRENSNKKLESNGLAGKKQNDRREDHEKELELVIKDKKTEEATQNHPTVNEDMLSSSENPLAAAHLELLPDDFSDDIDFQKQAATPDASKTDVVDELSKEDLIALENELREEQRMLQKDNLKQMRQAATLSTDVYQDVQEMLRLFGIPYIVSPMEAEAQCAHLELVNLTDGSITDDGDVFLFGGEKVYKNIFNKKNYAEFYQTKELESILYLNRQKLIAIAFLTGSDYTEGLHGVGYVAAMEILHAFSNPEPAKSLADFKKWMLKLKSGHEIVNPISSLKSKLMQSDIPGNFNSPTVWEAYLEPVVDRSEERFKWGQPDEDAIKDYASEKLGWLGSRTNDILKPVLTRWAEKTKAQKTIDRYFSPQLKLVGTGVTSKRLLKVLNKVSTEIGDDELASIANELDPSPPTNKKELRQQNTNSKTGNTASYKTSKMVSNKASGSYCYKRSGITPDASNTDAPEFLDASLEEFQPEKKRKTTPRKNRFNLNQANVSANPEIQAKKVRNLMNAAAENFKPLPPFIQMSNMNRTLLKRLKGKKVAPRKRGKRQKAATDLLNKAQAISATDAPKPLISSESDSE